MFFTGTLVECDEQIQGLQIQLKESSWELNELKRKCARQQQEISTLREQRGVLLEEREVAIKERGAALKERDEALGTNEELRNNRDKAVAAQIAINHSLQADYDRLQAELETLRHELSVMTGQYEFAQLKLRHEDKVKRFHSYDRRFSAPLVSSCSFLFIIIRIFNCIFATKTSTSLGRNNFLQDNQDNNLQTRLEAWRPGGCSGGRSVTMLVWHLLS